MIDITYPDADNRDGMAHQGQAGLRGYLGQGDLITYQVWGGWQFRGYDNGDLKNFNNFIGHGEIVYKPNDLTSLSVGAVRRPEESVGSGQTFYVRNELYLQLRRQIAQNWFVNAQGAVALNDYSNDRLDFRWEPGAGVEYLLPGKILSLFGQYKYSGRESDAANSDYSRHLVNFGIKAQV